MFVNLAANIKQYGRGVTLYCSANDRAMSASRRVRGRRSARRRRAAGRTHRHRRHRHHRRHADLSTDVLALNHSSYAEKSALLNDIGLLLLTGERPPERRAPVLQKVQAGAASFWRFP